MLEGQDIDFSVMFQIAEFGLCGNGVVDQVKYRHALNLGFLVCSFQDIKAWSY
jgi:hypothetical protein